MLFCLFVCALIFYIYFVVVALMLLYIYILLITCPRSPTAVEQELVRKHRTTKSKHISQYFSPYTFTTMRRQRICRRTGPKSLYLYLLDINHSFYLLQKLKKNIKKASVFISIYVARWNGFCIKCAMIHAPDTSEEESATGKLHVAFSFLSPSSLLTSTILTLLKHFWLEAVFQNFATNKKWRKCLCTS